MTEAKIYSLAAERRARQIVAIPLPVAIAIGATAICVAYFVIMGRAVEAIIYRRR